MELREFEVFAHEAISRVKLREEINEEEVIKYLKINKELIDTEKRELHKHLLGEERKLLEDLREKIRNYNLNIKIVTGRGVNILIPKETKPIKRKKAFVGLVVKDIPYKFRGADGRLYGPYKAGDIILINMDDYKLLRDTGYIREVTLE